MNNPNGPSFGGETAGNRPQLEKDAGHNTNEHRVYEKEQEDAAQAQNLIDDFLNDMDTTTPSSSVVPELSAASTEGGNVAGEPIPSVISEGENEPTAPIPETPKPVNAVENQIFEDIDNLSKDDGEDSGQDGNNGDSGQGAGGHGDGSGETGGNSGELDGKKEEIKNKQKNNKAVRNVMAAIGIVALTSIITAGTVIGLTKHTYNPSDGTPVASSSYKPSMAGMPSDLRSEQQKDVERLTKWEWFDEDVDFSLTQYDYDGMTNTPKASAENPLGKYSEHSVAATNKLANMAYGVETFDELETTQKLEVFEMSMCMQAESLMEILYGVDQDFPTSMSFEEATKKLKDMPEDERKAKLHEGLDIINKVIAETEKENDGEEGWKVDETTVGDVKKVVEVTPGSEGLMKWVEDNYDGTLTQYEKVTAQIVASMHHYIVDENPQANYVKTDDYVKVLEISFTTESNEQITKYVLERCFNGFVVSKHTDTITKKSTIKITYFGKPPEELEPKDRETLERIHKQILDDVAKDDNTKVVDPGYTVQVKPEDQTPQPTAQEYQGTEPEIVQNQETPTATVETPAISPENDASVDKGGANAGNAEQNPVKPNDQGQDEANKKETPPSEAPEKGSAEFDQTLSDLGIN